MSPPLSTCAWPFATNGWTVGWARIVRLRRFNCPCRCHCCCCCCIHVPRLAHHVRSFDFASSRHTAGLAAAAAALSALVKRSCIFLGQMKRTNEGTDSLPIHRIGFDRPVDKKDTGRGRTRKTKSSRRQGPCVCVFKWKAPSNGKANIDGKAKDRDCPRVLLCGQFPHTLGHVLLGFHSSSCADH